MVPVFWRYKRETLDARVYLTVKEESTSSYFQHNLLSYLITYGDNSHNRVAHQKLLECLSIDESCVWGGAWGEGQNTCNNTSTEVILRSPGYREN